MPRKRRSQGSYHSRSFDYTVDFSKIDFRAHPERYQVGRGEQGVLLVEPYKSELLPVWRFKDPKTAARSAGLLSKLFRRYKTRGEFVGMDMARKYLQMGFTRARRYANHASGRKYSPQGEILPRQHSAPKAEAALIFYRAWKAVEKDRQYVRLREAHKAAHG